ncbi:MAG: hypothetical protein HY423_05230 [Candidatus Lambdaproteobacteria bacterium]|nr:hypothetical protein [Candidatus Lambdaproteobacteria bacterium]
MNRDFAPIPAQRGRPRRAAFVALIAVLPAALGLPGCGLKTTPKPATLVLPPTEGVTLRQQDREVLLAWRVPTSSSEARWGGLRGYIVRMERRRLYCPLCDPIATRTWRYARDDRALTEEAGLAYVRYAAGAPREMLRFQVSTLFGAGTGAPSQGVALESVADVPAHTLRWQWLSPGSAGSRVARLYWEPRREQIYRILSAEGRLVERERFYRANLYRRVPRSAWPMAPLNPAPLELLQFQATLGGAGAPALVEFALRLVDQHGNEGPLSLPVTIGLERARP